MPKAKKTEAINDWTAPTTYLERFTQAVGLLCKKEPPTEIVVAWLDKEKDDFRLQEFAIEFGPPWAQGIVILDAAHLLAEEPVEGIDDEY